jgi:hypothetical protein
VNKIDPNFFQVGKLYEWKKKNSFYFHLYDINNDKINYSDCKANLVPGEIVFILEVSAKSDMSSVRMMTSTGIIAWGRIYHIHTESYWQKL